MRSTAWKYKVYDTECKCLQQSDIDYSQYRSIFAAGVLMAYARSVLASIPEEQRNLSNISEEHRAPVQPEYITVVNPLT